MNTVMVCSNCGSKDVTRDALCSWGGETWEIAGLLDSANCNACGAEDCVVEKASKKWPALEPYTAVLKQILEHPHTWKQTKWHCGTSHCVAGWAEIIAAEGKAPEGPYSGSPQGVNYEPFKVRAVANEFFQVETSPYTLRFRNRYDLPLEECCEIVESGEMYGPATTLMSLCTLHLVLCLCEAYGGTPDDYIGLRASDAVATTTNLGCYPDQR